MDTAGEVGTMAPYVPAMCVRVCAVCDFMCLCVMCTNFLSFLKKLDVDTSAPRSLKTTDIPGKVSHGYNVYDRRYMTTYMSAHI